MSCPGLCCAGREARELFAADAGESLKGRLLTVSGAFSSVDAAGIGSTARVACMTATNPCEEETRCAALATQIDRIVKPKNNVVPSHAAEEQK